MKKPILLGLLSLLTPCLTLSQVLQPPINSGILPADTDPVCAFTPFSGSFETNGFNVGDTVAQFTVFDLNNNSFDLQTGLQDGKPVLLIAASLTCPIFRNNIPEINDVVSIYGTALKTIIIYTIEAHPTDISPYSGTVNITQQNMNENIYFAQPTTYDERKNLLDTLLDLYTINAPIYLDGPCNEWWENFGPAPNNAYLIDSNGVVFAKHGMMNEFPQDIFCDIDSLLGTSGNCSPSNPNGTFSLYVIDTVKSGTPGSVIYNNAKLINNTSNDAEIMIRKIEENYASGWNSSFCVDGTCYLTSADSAAVLVPANDTIDFSLDFFTGMSPDTSNVKVKFKNVNFISNQFTFRFFAYTTQPAFIDETNPHPFQFFPNPSNGNITINTGKIQEENFELTWYDLTGKKLFSQTYVSAGNILLDTNLEAGIYILQVKNNSSVYAEKIVISK